MNAATHTSDLSQHGHRFTENRNNTTYVNLIEVMVGLSRSKRSKKLVAGIIVEKKTLSESLVLKKLAMLSVLVSNLCCVSCEKKSRKSATNVTSIGMLVILPNAALTTTSALFCQKAYSVIALTDLTKKVLFWRNNFEEVAAGFVFRG